MACFKEPQPGLSFSLSPEGIFQLPLPKNVHCMQCLKYESKIKTFSCTEMFFYNTGSSTVHKRGPKCMFTLYWKYWMSKLCAACEMWYFYEIKRGIHTWKVPGEVRPFTWRLNHLDVILFCKHSQLFSCFQFINIYNKQKNRKKNKQVLLLWAVVHLLQHCWHRWRKSHENE